ncbi:uncharacterized protein Z518_02453 [Rhinocladiella mackenziei CBS 650.93]|uniref:Zn(2)-C6 fungal-type domain-containing protein n=1 Tax=Rhinocladiella mackenziei CBS 650.93 TaxID=1442369 RepID=A0A0D2IPI1_9EURO|nr:uncharacterized protein Z518_02453 [Rhinocladiella mackenziei CBS 650.93]KIX07799.1 hypothetical protein Z518_02453 [Rhinocladiella mackenziei CBS 650.93]
MFHITPTSEPEGGNRVPKACFPCARAKVRCEIEHGAGICKRCQRLKKPCSGQIPGAHKRKEAQKSDVTRLEQKLDGVTAILTTSERIGGPSFEGPALLSPTASVEHFIKTDGEAELILETYRSYMAPYFPFVVIPPNVDVNRFKEQKPVLFLTIAMVGCRHDRWQQSALGKRVREIISHKVLIKGEQSLDLLQGLLVYLAWYHFHLHLGNQLTNLTYLTISMMTDLGLYKEPNSKSRLRYANGSLKHFRKDPTPAATRTLEERRAFLGCFYTSAVVSICARDIETVRYSKYAEECCHILGETAEYSSDQYLVQLIRLYCLGEKINRTLNHDEIDTSSGLSTPIGACVKLFEVELRRLKASLPLDMPQSSKFHSSQNHPTLTEQAILLVNYHAIEIVLYEIALNDNIDPIRYGSLPMTRLNMLHACLNGAKACFELFYTTPVSIYFDLPHTVWALVGHAIAVTSMLTVFVSDGWDQNYVHNTLNFCSAIDTMAQKVEEAKEHAQTSIRQVNGSSNGSTPRIAPEIFMTLAPKLQMIKEAHEARRLAQLKTLDNSQVATPSEGSIPAAAAAGFDDDPTMPGAAALFEFLDDSFWQQFT